MTAEALKTILQTPALLLILMLAASVSNGLKQLNTNSAAGGSMTCIEYFFKHWPDTLNMVLTNCLCFAVLILTDQLNFASALGVGYGANSIVDMLPGSRSNSLANSVKKDGP